MGPQKKIKLDFVKVELIEILDSSDEETAGSANVLSHKIPTLDVIEIHEPVDSKVAVLSVENAISDKKVSALKDVKGKGTAAKADTLQNLEIDPLISVERKEMLEKFYGEGVLLEKSIDELDLPW